MQYVLKRSKGKQKKIENKEKKRNKKATRLVGKEITHTTHPHIRPNIK